MRIDSEGRDVTDLPGLWNESDRVVDSRRVVSRTIHMCISIRGMLGWSKTETKRMLRSITRPDGSRFSSVDEFRNALLDDLEKGKKVLPMTDPPCEGFSYETGCPGHEDRA